AEWSCLLLAVAERVVIEAAASKACDGLQPIERVIAELLRVIRARIRDLLHIADVVIFVGQVDRPARNAAQSHPRVRAKRLDDSVTVGELRDLSPWKEVIHFGDQRGV